MPDNTKVNLNISEQ